MQAPAPRRQLNFYQTTSIIIGAVIGSGVFINLPIVAKFGGSPLLSVLIWLIGGVLWIPQILILAEMGTAYPNQGGPYYYLYKAGSPFLAFLYTWTAFLTSDTPTITIIGLTAASALKFFFPELAIPLYARVFASVLIILLALIQYRSVKLGGNFQILLSLAKVMPLILLIIIGFFYLNSGGLNAPAVNKASEGGSFFFSLTAGISSTLWAYAGFLNILYMAGEVKNPERTLPRSLIWSIIFVILVYTFVSLCTSAIVPFSSLISASGDFINPFSYLKMFSGFAGSFFAIAAFISMVGVLNSVIMTQPRLEYAMARDKLFFNTFGHLHPKYLTPDYSIFIQTALSIVLFLLGDIENMLGYFTLSYVLQNALVYGAIFFLRKRADYNPSFKSRLWHVWAAFSILIQLYIAWGSFMAYPSAGLIACLGLIGTGLPVYRYFYSAKKSRFPESPAE
ncbi:MAG TPA: amino acid permease [Ignavibacteriales bacterium]|nr:amino acid permease [Ignavibacteriales bacterium]